MSDFLPLYISVILCFVLLIVVPSALEPFITEGQYNADSYLTHLINFIENGIPIGPNFLFWEIELTRFKPFSLFPDSFSSWILDVIIVLTYIPDVVSIPLITIIIFGFLYTLITMFLP